METQTLPSGPVSQVPTREQTTLQAFKSWLLRDVGREFYKAAAASALLALASGETRWSALGFIHEYRHEHHVRITNTWAPHLSDTLIEDHNDLVKIIERQ